MIKYLALGFNVDDKILCCSCTLRVAKESEMASLFFCTNKPIRVKAESKCPDCGCAYSHTKSETAAVEIQQILEGK